MSDIKLGIQSWCFRHFKDNEVMLPMLKATGVDAVELCGVHADFKTAEGRKKAVDVYKKFNVKIMSTGVNGFTGNEAVDSMNFEFLKASGAKHMSVDFAPDNLDRDIKIAEKLAEKYDVTLGIHNHGGAHWLGNSQVLRWVFGKCSKRIGLSFDTAWALDSGENVLKMVQEFKDRLYLIHLKDFTYDKNRKPEDVVMGTGCMDLKAMKKTLDDIGFKGIYIIEYEGDVEAPVPALTKCVKNIKAAL
jgi:sugar phosphate isomerase/epimerase